MLVNFGLTSPLTIHVKRLLYAETINEFHAYWENKKHEIIESLNKTTNQHIAQFCKLFVCSFENGQLSSSSFNFQGLWNRSLKHVPTCSNHIESYHSQLNFNGKSCHLYIKRIEILFNYIKERLHVGLKRNNLKKFIDSFKNQSRDINHSFCKPQKFKECLFGINQEDSFICVHNYKEFKIIPFPAFHKDTQSITVDIRVGNEEYYSWDFMSKENFPIIPLGQDDQLLVCYAGFPEWQYLKDYRCVFQKSDKITKPQKRQFLEYCFIHYCCLTQGEYCYEPVFMNKFKCFVSNFIQGKASFHDLKQDENRKVIFEMLKSYHQNRDMPTFQDLFGDNLKDIITEETEIDNLLNEEENEGMIGVADYEEESFEELDSVEKAVTTIQENTKRICEKDIKESEKEVLIKFIEEEKELLNIIESKLK